MQYNSKCDTTPDINITYKRVFGAELPLSIYLPDGFDKDKKYPAVVAIHGGGWYAALPSSPKWEGGVMAHNAIYYKSKGIVGITFSYRSINISPYTEVKDLISDCSDALTYIKNNFDFIDMEKVVFLGDSAGGHLALSLVMGLCLSDALPITPKQVVACNPVTDCVCEKWSYCAKTTKERAISSPAHNIKRVSPKILLIHGTADACVDIDDSRRFLEKMKEAGNNIEMLELEGRKHAFIIYSYRDSDAEVSAVHEIIDRYIL